MPTSTQALLFPGSAASTSAGTAAGATTREFPPTREAALDRLARVRPADYVRTRNHLDGAVTGLSPYLTHGLLDIGEAIATIHRRHRLTASHKLVFEFAWREYFQHVWRHAGATIFDDMRPGLAGVTYAARLPDDVREGRTGVAAIDWAVRELYATGYLHNHARMWLASYLVHSRKVHWRAGADWLYGHLLDGDLASNSLSWQWVAATFSARPYLFNADNVARYAPVLDCGGTAIDTGYDALERRARGPEVVGPEPGRHPGIAAPVLSSDTATWAADPRRAPWPETLRGMRVALVHPWDLGARPRADLVLGIVLEPFHARFPWSARRREFVLSRMAAICDRIVVTTPEEARARLEGAREVRARQTFNPVYHAFFSGTPVQAAAAPRFFPDPARMCGSFSHFWRHIAGFLDRFDQHATPNPDPA
jgi:deoxyribodipyrimidine photo-lyase